MSAPLGFLPLIRHDDRLEIQSRPGVVDPDDLDDDPEAGDVSPRMLIQPFKGLAVFVSQLLGDPHKYTGVEAPGVRQYACQDDRDLSASTGFR